MRGWGVRVLIALVLGLSIGTGALLFLVSGHESASSGCRRFASGQALPRLARARTMTYRLRGRLTGSRCDDLVEVTQSEVSHGRARVTATAWHSNQYGRWRLVRQAVVLGPYDHARVQLSGARLADVNRDGLIELKVSFRVRSRVPTLASYSLVTVLEKAQTGKAFSKSIAAGLQGQSELPAQGVYEECAPSRGSECIARLEQIAAAGFQVVLNYTAWYGSSDQIQAYADAARRLGLKLIWPLNATAWRANTGLIDQYGQLARSCRCAAGTDAALMRYAITLVARDPATWGFYIGDEPGSSDLPAIAGLSSRVRDLAPGLPLLAVFSASQPGLPLTLAAFAPYLDAMGIDEYPIGTDVPVSDIGASVATLQRISTLRGIASVAVLQAFSWAEYPAQSPTRAPLWPTRAEMRQELTEATQHGTPALILWYSAYDVWRSSEPAQHWADLVWAALGK
jgi:hypothetical protein